MPTRMLQRPLASLIAALRRHVELLRISARHAFDEHDERSSVRLRLSSACWWLSTGNGNNPAARSDG